jgi:hypothetical protein
MRGTYVREQLGYLVHITHVAGKGLGAAAAGGYTLCHGGTVIQLAAGDDHVCTLLGQQPGYLFTNTATGTTDQRDLSGQVKQVCCHINTSFATAPLL